MVIGEVFLSLPLYFLESPLTRLQQSVLEGTWQTFSFLPINSLKALVFICCVDLPRVLLRIFLILGSAYLFFDLNFQTADFLKVLFLQLLAIPCFLGIGLFACGIFILTNKGRSFIGYISTISAFLAGGFFPLSVLPDWMTKFSIAASPFTVLLESTRDILSGGNGLLKTILILLVWDLLLLIGSLFFTLTQNNLRKSGRVLLVNE
jgi:ABC-type polysaccharide/polyol phosphate export permease